MSTPLTSLLSRARLRDYVLIIDQKSSGTNGGTFTSGAFRTRDLNTIVSDLAGLAAVATNQITLQPGTYEYRINCPAVLVNYHQARLQNITDTTTVSNGSSEYSDNTTGGHSLTRSIVTGAPFTISTAKVFEVQHRCSSTLATTGFGGATSFGTVEIYTICEFWRIFGA